MLGTPPAFILSQDQTLRKDPYALFLVSNPTLTSKAQHQSSFRTRTLSYHSLVVKVLLLPHQSRSLTLPMSSRPASRRLVSCVGTFDSSTLRTRCQVYVAFVAVRFRSHSCVRTTTNYTALPLHNNRITSFVKYLPSLSRSGTSVYFTPLANPCQIQPRSFNVIFRI